MTPDEQKQFNQLKKDFEALKAEYYRNNFSSSQDFQKYCRFNGRFKITHYDSLPATGELNICSAVDTWTVVGTQT